MVYAYERSSYGNGVRHYMHTPYGSRLHVRRLVAWRCPGVDMQEHTKPQQNCAFVTVNSIQRSLATKPTIFMIDLRETLSSTLLYAAGRVGAFPGVRQECSQYSHRRRRPPQSDEDHQRWLARENEAPRHTAAARSRMARPAMAASSWLSLISMLITCTIRLKSPPRESRSAGILLSRMLKDVLEPRTVAYTVEATLLTRDYDIRDRPRFLPPLWRALNLPISIEHLQEAVGGVSSRSDAL
jgi:hypothetical protein